MMHRAAPGLRAALWAFVPVAFAALVFLPITRSYFRSDDFLHLYEIARGDVLAFLIRPRAGHLYVVRNAIFALSYRLFGPYPAGFQWTAFVTHLANVLLLVLVLRALVRSVRLAALGATLWAICPLSAGSLDWYSVYGHVLATTLLFIVLWDVLRDGPAAPPPATHRVFTWVFLMLLSAGCFGTAVGVATAFPLVLALLRPATYRTWTARVLLALLPVVVAATYLALPRLYLRLYPDGVLEGQLAYSLAITRATGAGPIAEMTRQLIGAGLAGLVLGVAQQPVAYPSLAATVVGGLAAAGALVTLVRGPWPRRSALVAFVLIALAAYGSVAAGRAALLLTMHFGSLADAAAVPRYHYTGTAALAVALTVMLAALPDPLAQRPRWKDAALLAGLVALVATYATRGVALDDYAANRAETAQVLAAIDAQLRVAPPGRPVDIENRPFLAVGPMVSGRDFPGWAAVFAIFHPSNVVDGHTVRFVTWGPALEARDTSARMAALLVPSPSH